MLAAKRYLAVSIDLTAVEGVPNCIGGLHVSGHVPIIGFGPGKRSVQRVDRNRGWIERGADRSYQCCMIGNEGHWRGHQVKRNRARIFGKLSLAEGFDAILERRTSLKGAIDDGALAHPPPAVVPADRGVHKEIEHEKRLAAFR